MRICHQFISTAACFVTVFALAFAQGKPPPKDGYVPDADTAIKIAVVVWSRIYGEREIAAEKPYRATLKHGASGQSKDRCQRKRQRSQQPLEELRMLRSPKRTVGFYLSDMANNESNPYVRCQVWRASVVGG